MKVSKVWGKYGAMLAGMAVLASPLATGSAVFADTTTSAPATAATSAIYVSASAAANGTGTQDAPYQTISQAVAAAAAGSTIIVEPGTYKEMVVITKPVTLESDATAKDAASTTIIDATGNDNGILVKGTAASGTSVLGLTVENANQAGILAIGPISNLTFENNIVTNNAIGPIPPLVDFEALHLMGATNSLIENNQVVNNADGGIYLTDEPGPSNYNFVIGNTVKGNKIDCGITLASHVPNHGVSNNVVANNDSEGNGAAGVFLGTPVPNGIVSGNIVRGNTVSGNLSGGIVMHTHAPGSTVDGNIIVFNTISGNKADADVTNADTGISIGASLSPITKTFIYGNAISSESINIFTNSLSASTLAQSNVSLPW